MSVEPIIKKRKLEQAVKNLISQLVTDDFYGELTIRFDNGVINYVKEQKSLTGPQLEDQFGAKKKIVVLAKKQESSDKTIAET
jgi:hypothetical protein